MKVLIINGHPTMETSNANKAILEEVKRLLPEVEVSQLQALYPNYQFDVAAEQAKLVKADVIVWQFPVNWYSVPALLKKWIDDVFAFGFAYGTDYKLEGKKLLLSFTTGAPQEAYQKGGYPISDFLFIHKQTANFTKMEFVEPVYSYGMLYIPGAMPEEALLAVQQKAKDHAARLVAQIKKIS
ncbi:NAD(P)H-dependent oxidoreductase [Capnocytophaga leadbetteri]|uniref:NAD(P)H-dependent oxidoreductase n=1 Tax=Capnocytophaga leadbetteri TaxID=327575 RepID=UPI0026F15655|nr:NAD(P)H-dependent oxidoreductase [Capnocytophaga leadbetteri]